MRTPDVETIAVGVDSSEASLRAFEWALEEAKRSNRRLDIIHVWHAGDHGAPRAIMPLAPQWFRDAGFAMLRRFVQKALHEGVRATFHLIEGELPADLLRGCRGCRVAGGWYARPILSSLFDSHSSRTVCTVTVRVPIG